MPVSLKSQRHTPLVPLKLKTPTQLNNVMFEKLYDGTTFEVYYILHLRPMPNELELMLQFESGWASRCMNGGIRPRLWGFTATMKIKMLRRNGWEWLTKPKEVSHDQWRMPLVDDFPSLVSTSWYLANPTFSFSAPTFPQCLLPAGSSTICPRCFNHPSCLQALVNSDLL